MGGFVRVPYTDDTPVLVLDASLPKTRTARFRVHCGDWRNPYTVYDYTTSRRRNGRAKTNRVEAFVYVHDLLVQLALGVF